MTLFRSGLFTLANSEDPDEMLHFVKFMCIACLDQNNIQALKNIL